MRTISEIRADIAANKAVEYAEDDTDTWEKLCDKDEELRNELLQVITAEIGYDRLAELCQAERNGRVVVLPYPFCINIFAEEVEKLIPKVVRLLAENKRMRVELEQARSEMRNDYHQRRSD